MAKFVSGAMAWVGLLAACAGETNMTDAAALERQIHDLEKEVRRLSAQMKTEKYGLRWVDCPEAFEAESENKIPILAEVPEKAISHKDGKPTHILIEGDNYHALTCLNFTHRGKIDVIYIDPPYNTGSDGFTYKDKRYLEKYPDGTSVPKDHPLRHSYWLSFMSKRLRLAKDLLSDRGVIFISIDDNEMANLKLLCDQVFQEKNFVADVIWHSKYTTSNDANGISRQHEHVLVYAKSIGKMKFGLLERTAEMDAAYKNPDNDPNGPWKATPLHAKSGTASSLYTLTFPNGRTWSAPKGRYPRYSKESLMRIYESGGLYFRKSGGIDRKTYLSEVKGGKTPGSIWSFDEVGSTHQANEELAEILGKGVFDNPKPVELIKRCFAVGCATNDITALDFFAGSGTALQATLMLNEEDAGRRKCILVQQREGADNICERVTYERNKRVMNGYRNVKGDAIPPLGGSLKYYKTEFVGKHRCTEALDEDRAMLAAKAGTLLALAEETLYEQKLPKKDSKYWQHFTDGAHRHTLIYFSDDLCAFGSLVKAADAIRGKDKAARVSVYVFSIGSVEGFENEFDDMRHITLKPIPEPILAIYKAINGD